MQMTAGQIFKDLEAGKWKPFYLVAGEETFQSDELVSRLKEFFIKDEISSSFNFESWDAEHVDAGALLASLETLPGLFAAADSVRLVVCHHFEKANAHTLEVLEHYFKNPSESTALVLLATKADKRKAWVKAVDERGAILEVNEPYDREWPRWQPFFEKKLGKKIAKEAWDLLVEQSGRSLSVLWSDLQKVSVFVGKAEDIRVSDISALGVLPGGEDIFALADDVLFLRPYPAVKKFSSMVQSGESEVKILAILVRQFRQVQRYLELSQKGVTDPKAIGPQMGIHPFFVTKLSQQARLHSLPKLRQTFHTLAESDYRLKTGEAGLFESFFVPYFAAQ
jgi:DNA polymerase III subunit delta